jgi:rhodanese-related sulfurtransferase
MMNRYVFISVVFIALGLGLVLLPEKVEQKGLRPDLLLLEANNNDRFLSTDLIASRIIDGDPRVLLVDVRLVDYYDEYNIPGAINIPLADLAYDSILNTLNQTAQDVIFYSNSTLLADQAWMICRKNNFKHIYVMEGGLNKWFKEIMMPQPPLETEGTEAQDLYGFRLGASVFFGMPAPFVEYQEAVQPKAKASASAPAPKKEEVIELVMPEEEEEEEGC